jgi:hypothetical protein
MDFDELEQPAWGVLSPKENDMTIVKETVRKEQSIRYVETDFSSTSHR